MPVLTLRISSDFRDRVDKATATAGFDTVSEFTRSALERAVEFIENPAPPTVGKSSKHKIAANRGAAATEDEESEVPPPPSPSSAAPGEVDPCSTSSCGKRTPTTRIGDLCVTCGRRCGGR